MMINIVRQGLCENIEEMGERLCCLCYFYNSPALPRISMSHSHGLAHFRSLSILSSRGCRVLESDGGAGCLAVW